MTVTGPSTLKGNARWMAVELISDGMTASSETNHHQLHTKETDVWAYGMVVYVGCRPSAINMKSAETVRPSLPGASYKKAAILPPYKRSFSDLGDHELSATNRTTIRGAPFMLQRPGGYALVFVRHVLGNRSERSSENGDCLRYPG